MTLNLSADQADACERIREWVYARCDRWKMGIDGEILTFSGLAGSGKTTVLGVLAKEFQDRHLLVAYATFTGRASSILSRKLADQDVMTSNRQKASSPRQLDGKFARFFLKEGEERVPFCGTLHRLLYAPFVDEETEELKGWRTRPTLDRRYGLIVVDEASMVSDEMLRDLKRHGVAILACGDHGQLAPVMGSSSLMRNPDIKLEKIHRQAADNPIIQLAHTIRETGHIDRSLAGPTIDFRKRTELGEIYAGVTWRGIRRDEALETALEVGAICWTNKTRSIANRTVRKALGFSGPPRAGEPIVCLKNYDEVYNGMRGVLVSDSVQRGWQLDARIAFPADGIDETDYELCGYQLFREKTFQDVKELQRLAPSIGKMSDAGKLFDMGYCMTVHKLQGSSLQHAILIADRPFGRDEETRRFYYTATTRAVERLTVLL
jgi:exodeoxyribonuclease-5